MQPPARLLLVTTVLVPPGEYVLCGCVGPSCIPDVSTGDGSDAGRAHQPGRTSAL
jgi:hypothetical protein